MSIDFEAEGLLDGVESEEARKARVELLEKLTDDGVELDELKQACEEGRLVLLPVERTLAGDGKRYTQEEVADQSGVELEVLKRIWRALGMAEAPPGRAMFTREDLDAAKAGQKFLDAGIPQDEVLQLTRSLSQAMSGVAAAVGGSFADALIQEGDTEADLAVRYANATRELVPMLDDALLHVLHLQLRERARTAVIGDAELAAGTLAGSQTVGVGFVDLVGFTKLGERVPTEELGTVAGRLEEMAADVACGPVRLVKTIGDAAMLASDRPDALIEAALELVETAESEGESFPSLHAGLAWGDALPRGGDFYGKSVNLASRITDISRPGTVVASADLREAAEGDYDWSRLPRRRLKGIKGDTELYRVHPPGD